MRVRQGLPAQAEANTTVSIASIRNAEVALNQKIKNLIQKLGEAIHESVAESEHIAGVVRNIREQGFDVMLMLEATIGLNEVTEEEEGDGQQLQLTAGETADGPFTHNDLSFLKSLRISLPEDRALPAPDQAGGAESQGPNA